MKITVFTPTYNRAYCLERLFESLKAQTFKDFEWVIVDDGSVDHTTELVQQFIDSKPDFSIVYKKTENGGKHRAINRGLKLASGKLFFFVDSDDWLREDALECVDRVETSIPENKKNMYAGVHGLCVHSDGCLVGKTFEGVNFIDSTTIERKKHNIQGDKAEVYYTELLKKYPFPEIEGEKFLTEKLVWNEIAHDGYLIRYFNEGIYFCEYLQDGLTHGGNLLYARNPKQWAMSIYQDYMYGESDFYSTNLQIYKYYFYKKDSLSFKKIKEYLGFSYTRIVFSVILQSIIDFLRFILKHHSIYGYIKEELERGNS